MPSPRPVKPSPSVVVALTLTCSGRMPRYLGDPRAHRRAVRADLGRFGDESAIDSVDHCSAGAHQALRRGRGTGPTDAPFHCGSRRREMLADVAKPRGAEQGVGDRVEHDVGVAMPGEAARVGDGNPAEHDRAVAAEGVDVEAHAGARGQAARQPVARREQSRRRSNLVERGIAVDGCNREARRPAPRSSRRSAAQPRPVGISLLQRMRDERPAESGRGRGRSGRPPRRASRRLGRACRRPRAPAPRHRRIPEAASRRSTTCRWAEGTCGVVDQHGVGLDRREAGADRVRALGPAGDEWADIERLQAPPTQGHPGLRQSRRARP